MGAGIEALVRGEGVELAAVPFAEQIAVVDAQTDVGVARGLPVEDIEQEHAAEGVLRAVGKAAALDVAGVRGFPAVAGPPEGGAQAELGVGDDRNAELTRQYVRAQHGYQVDGHDRERRLFAGELVRTRRQGSVTAGARVAPAEAWTEAAEMRDAHHLPVGLHADDVAVALAEGVSVRCAGHRFVDARVVYAEAGLDEAGLRRLTATGGRAVRAELIHALGLRRRSSQPTE